MKRTLRTTTILFLVTSCVLFVFLGVFVSPTFATLPSGYETAADGNDWYFGEDYLNLEELKTTVKGWFEDERVYDFSHLETDPIVVAIIDTGVNFDHELFDGFYDADGNPIEDDGSVSEYDVFYRDIDGSIICKNTVTETEHKSESILDDAKDMHGTHVAGIVATLIHALDLEKYIKIMPIKAAYPSSDGSTFSEDAFAAALAFAVTNGADVINMSLSSSSVSFGTAVTDEIADNAVCVAAAGNGKIAGTDSSTKKYYPGAASNVIGVMNLTHGLLGYDVYTTSNYGDAYDIGAPGYKIVSADGATDDGYKTLNGTSMASPIVAFGAALATLKYSALAEATGSVNAKTPRQIASIIKSSHSKSIIHKGKNIYVFDMNVFAKDEGVYSLAVDCDENALNQKLGDLKAINFEATLLPSNEQNVGLAETVKWYKQNADSTLELLGQGRQFAYTPANNAGTTTIVAKYDGEDQFSASKVVTVEYKSPSKEETKISEEAVPEKYEIGKKYKFAIKNATDYDSSAVVIWYVNGEYKANGFEFEFAPTEYGTYKITVKMNGTALDDSRTIVVKDARKSKEDTYKYFLIAIGCVFGLVVVLSVGSMVLYSLKRNKE